MGFIKFFLITVGVLYCLFLCAIYFYQKKMIFVPEKLNSNFRFNFNGPFEEGNFTTKKGLSINHISFKGENPDGIIIYFHGNAGSLSSWGFAGEEMATKLNKEVLIFDYPGYGKSEKELAPDGENLIQIGLQLVESARKNRPDTPIFLHGRSIGSGIASEVSLRTKVDGLVLETPYLSMAQLIKKYMPLAPTFLLRFKMDNTKLQNLVGTKLLILHGTEDATIPYDHSVKLQNLLGSKSKMITLKGGEHNNLPTFDKYWKALQDFYGNVEQ